MEKEQTPHKRRVRYSGTHPKTFKEKYKEHDPQKYQDTILKVIQKGNTPAGMHISIMVDEILQHLDIKKDEIGLDATLGYGGHTLAMLKKLDKTGHVYGLDVDTIEIEKTTKRLNDLGFNEDFFTSINTNFKNIDKVSLDTNQKFDFVLADLGVSSMQIDNPERGFTYKKDGPLDLRLNPSAKVMAKDRLNELSQNEIEGMLMENSDEPYAYEIAKEIIKHTSKGIEISTTTMLYDIIVSALLTRKITDKEVIKKTCQRVFQALRIDVNQEFEVLYDFLDKLPTILNKGARVCILTFHSGEDRLVKKAFKEGLKNGTYSSVSKDVIRPSLEECNKNPRARSTKLRYAIKS